MIYEIGLVKDLDGSKTHVGCMEMTSEDVDRVYMLVETLFKLRLASEADRRRAWDLWSSCREFKKVIYGHWLSVDETRKEVFG